MNFSELNLQPNILRALSEQGYRTPSPIQQEAIPPVLEGRDIIGCAQTGTGKTCAFAVPMIQQLLHRKGEPGKKRPIRALVLTPTRELAMQIFESFRAYAKYTRVRACVVFGGVGQKPQVEALGRGVDVLVATPGRLNDLIGQGYVDLSQLQIFVLDEADRMLDMGFIHDVRRIVQQIPKERQTLLFSATMPKEIEELAQSILLNPVKIVVAPPATTVEAIEQSVYFVDKRNKTKLLAYLLEDPNITSALVFTRTKHGADRVARDLSRAKISAQSIHGDKSQAARQQALKNFKTGKTRVLVATDIAARGIDVNELSHVFNYNLPEVPETYVHRIGRTGRAGHGGVAIAFCDILEKPLLADIEKTIKKKVPVVADHPFPLVDLDVQPPQRGRQGQQRKPQPQQRQPQHRQPQHQHQKQKPQAAAPQESLPSTYNHPPTPIKKFKSVDEWMEHNQTPAANQANEIFDFARRKPQPHPNRGRRPGNRPNKRRQG